MTQGPVLITIVTKGSIQSSFVFLLDFLSKKRNIKGECLQKHPKANFHRKASKEMEEEPVKPTFEEAIERLEEIVNSMEEGDTPLAKLVDRFEEGTQLARTCQERLREAETRIALVKKNEEGFGLQEMSATEED